MTDKRDIEKETEYVAPYQKPRVPYWTIDWKEVHDRYVREGMTISELAGEYEIPYDTVKSRAYRESWSKHKKAWREANPSPNSPKRKALPKREVRDIEPQSPEEDKKSLDRSHSIAIQKLEIFINEAATTSELTKQIKALIDLRESDTLSNIERTQLTIDIPEEYSE